MKRGFLLLAFCLAGCQPFGNSFQIKTDLSSSNPCSAPQNISRSPKTIEDFVALINALPKPVSVSCVLESLERPLDVTLTQNSISAQPAAGRNNPRIFIMIDKLFISVVPDGMGAKVIELSYLVSDTTSIKAEIPFPVLSELSPDAPYSHILQSNSTTTCSVCHGSETRVESITFAEAYASTAFRPPANSLVPLEEFKLQDQSCNFDLEPERCAIIRAFLGHGEVRSKSFPLTIPPLF